MNLCGIAALATAGAAVLLGQGNPSAAGRWWQREPLRIIDVGTSMGGPRPEPAAIAARKAEFLFNAEHLHVMHQAGGLDDQHFEFRTSAGKVTDDYLTRYLPEAKKRGLRVFVYFNVHWYKPSFAAQHPDWVQVREDGRPLSAVYDTGTDFCINSPYREWAFQVVRDLAAYPIDGIFYDGPIFFPDTCYCRYCQAKFQKEYGTKLPSKKERRGPEFRKLIDFQSASMAEFLRDTQRVLKGVNPELALYMNGGLRAANWATARLNRVIGPEQDLLGAEGGFISGDLTRVPIWKPGVNARLLETQAGGKPTMIFSAAGHKPWTFSILPAPELRLLYAGSIASAANVWFGLSVYELDAPEMDALREMNDFVARNAAYLKNTRSEARVAIVWSDTTANFYQGADAQLIDIDRIPQRSEVGNLEGEFAGITDAVLRSHTPFDVIDDVTLEREPLDRYQAILLPNVACMSDRVAARLKEYVRGGGNLFATFETSLYDDTGIRRKDFALAEVFGAGDGGRIVGPTRWDFMNVDAGAKADPLLAGAVRDFLASTTYHVLVKAAAARPLLFFTQPLKGRYDGVPPVSDEPVLLVHQFGKGRVIYFSGDLGNSLQQFKVGEHYRLLRNALARMAPSPVRLENAPSSIEVVLRSQDNGRRWLLHLINSTGEMTRPIQRVVPLEGVRVSFPATMDFRTARTLMKPRQLTVSRTGSGGAQFTLPRLAEYEAVLLEK